jgi:signal transduction histidine kinase
MKRILRILSQIPHRGQFIYAIVVILLIPIFLIGNTLWALHSFQRDMNQVARDQSTIALDILKSIALQNLVTVEQLPAKLQAIIKENKTIQGITYLTTNPNKPGEFQVIATTDELLGNEDATFDLVKWSSADTQSYIGLTQHPRTGRPNWTIAAKSNAFLNFETVVIVLHTDAGGTDTLLKRTSMDSLLILGVTLFVVMLLLLNHLKFFDYANLYTKLKEVDQMKDDFLSTASHELRTPLTAIRGFADMAVKHITDEQKLRHDLQVISISASRLAGLVEDMLDVSRIEQGRMKLDMQKVSIVSVIAEVIEELSVQAQDKGLKISHNRPADEYYILADRNKLKQIYINIIGNAVKYTLNGEVTVLYELNKGTVNTIVKDSGIGMTSEQREKLFSKFYRIQTDETKNIQGTGLGLWITKQMVELMKGKISVDSMKGIGSQFSITFPTII